MPSTVRLFPRFTLFAFLLAACQSDPATEPRPDRPATESHPGVAAHRPPVAGIHGLVTTGGQPLAAMAGVRTLMNGGNAIDGAVAVMAALNVVQPEMTGAGGNGFITYYEKSTGRVYSLHMTGATPLALNADSLTHDELNAGYKAGITPGQIGGWIEALDRFGTKTLGEVLTPAIGYAIDGHPIDARVVRSITNREDFRDYPTSARIFLPNGAPPVPGQLFKQEDLGQTFQRLVEAEAGALRQGRGRSAALAAASERFYRGDIADEIEAFYREHGGLLTKEDLAAYRPSWEEPVHTTYRGYDVYSNPSSSRGGYETVMQLNLIEGFDLQPLGHNSAELIHLTAEAIKVAKADIYQYVGDPKFTSIPAEMVSKAYADTRRALIRRDRALDVPPWGDPARMAAIAPDENPLEFALAPSRFPERSVEGSTTSFSVADSQGNVAVVTPTLGSLFGTGVVIGNTGLFLNNGSRIGSTSPYPENVNFVRGGQIPLLNNSPIVVLKDGQFKLGVGSPGGETIGQTQFQTLIAVLDFGMGIQEAIEATRFSLVADPNFYRTGATVTMQLEDRVSAETLAGLRSKGHQVDLREPYSVGNMQGILADPVTGALYGGADPRSSGYAIGF